MAQVSINCGILLFGKISSSFLFFRSVVYCNKSKRGNSIDELRRIIAPIASAHGVKSVSVFGSYSRGSASADSDVDLKIEKGRLRSLFQLSGFRLAVEDALHLPVDMVTTEASDPDFLEMIQKDEVVLYRNA